MVKKLSVLLVSAVIALVTFSVVPGIVLAAEPGGAQVDGTATQQTPYQTTPNSISVTGGYIYKANINGTQVTYHWTGVYGNATGTLVLGSYDGSNNHKMYEWTAKAKYVIFDDDNTIDWSNLATATCSDVEGVYNYLTGASDDCDSTFTGTGNVDFVSLSDVTGTVLAQTYNNTQAKVWNTYAVKDGTNDVIFVAEVDQDYGTAYDGSTVNYQAILPENEDADHSGTSTYYLWVELI